MSQLESLYTFNNNNNTIIKLSTTNIFEEVYFESRRELSMKCAGTRESYIESFSEAVDNNNDNACVGHQYGSCVQFLCVKSITLLLSA